MTASEENAYEMCVACYISIVHKGRELTNRAKKTTKKISALAPAAVLLFRHSDD